MNWQSWLIVGLLAGLFIGIVVREIAKRKKGGGCSCGCGGCAFRDTCHKK